MKPPTRATTLDDLPGPRCQAALVVQRITKKHGGNLLFAPWLIPRLIPEAVQAMHDLAACGLASVRIDQDGILIVCNTHAREGQQ